MNRKESTKLFWKILKEQFEFDIGDNTIIKGLARIKREAPFLFAMFIIYMAGDILLLVHNFLNNTSPIISAISIILWSGLNYAIIEIWERVWAKRKLAKYAAKKQRRSSP